MENELEVLDRSAEEIIKDLGIPPCPAILTTLMREMRSDDPDFNKLGKLIGGDVSLAGAMLKTVNSPFYGLPRKATSVQQALALLGLRNVAEIVTTLLLRQAFAGAANDALEEFWEVSSAIAGLSAMLASRLKGKGRDEAYTFALFRDCGMLAMIGKFPGYVARLPGSAGEGDKSIPETEDMFHEINHAWVGNHLAQNWLLPEDTCAAILWHHDYAALRDGSTGISPAAVRNIAITLAAQSIYCRHDLGLADPEWQRGGEFALGQLGLTQDALDEIGNELMKELAVA
jgi:HD-like signal output (HDOD) protein